MKPVYATGNAHKAKYFNAMVGVELDHEAVDVEEVQSLDIRNVVEHKAREAYRILKKPVIVEDTFLTFKGLGSLPGPFIKWFLSELGCEGLCKMLDGYHDRTAFAGAAIAYFDGENLEIFEKELEGTISNRPKGDSGFGWNVIFVPNASTKTLGEMSPIEFEQYYKQIKPFEEVANFLKNLG